MRIQRALARAGIASRRKAEELIAEGRVLVNGVPASIGQRVDTGSDVISVDGSVVETPAEYQWLVLNKPPGVLTTRADPQGRQTVFNLVPAVPGLTYVGRLDYMTEGVLLFTTDGAAANRLTHPRYEVERVYVATVRGDAARAAESARHGVELSDGRAVPKAVSARSVGRGRWEFEVTIAEGRTHEIRRLCSALGLEVERLVRTRYGPVVLGSLGRGLTRPLSLPERRAIERLG
ncbi:MAG TPA: pseudouridine synthase [Gemmatimonadaceae bacterium]|nr:pseudouridine synthase [Gemmatimonadaceae bacterium]